MVLVPYAVARYLPENIRETEFWLASDATRMIHCYVGPDHR